uniref:Uncharacterized protein n=1 Tax=Siphoviridae sp. ctneY2 TaxID=2825664 RepID=A0A8S5V708_9CAUD|nr:MAG TPA: hypothetical protein [Siphoviridae sp. ctneY2]DAQ11003.1 MAG TPA: hypothetical protein [Caudoviricetes sp.]
MTTNNRKPSGFLFFCPEYIRTELQLSLKYDAFAL